jgi:hypothetical protein
MRKERRSGIHGAIHPPLLRFASQSEAAGEFREGGLKTKAAEYKKTTRSSSSKAPDGPFSLLNRIVYSLNAHFYCLKYIIISVSCQLNFRPPKNYLKRGQRALYCFWTFSELSSFFTITP